MRKVITIPEISGEQKEEKGVEFTHYFDANIGWERVSIQPSYYHKIVYLGKCKEDGDMFAVYHENGSIMIYKGHLNNGTY